MPSRPANSINRSPAVSNLPNRATVAAARPKTPRPAAIQPVTRKAVPPAIRAGAPPARRAAVRTRSRAAFAATRPARTAVTANRIANRAHYARMARITVGPRAAVIFNHGWWQARRNLWRHRWCYLNRRGWWYWWGWSSWNECVAWVDNDWDDAWEYEYDDNVAFDDEVVYINEEPVATAEDYVELGKEIADVDEPAEDAEIEWLSLGVFAMATSDTDTDPRMMIQLVLAKDGRVGGTYFHYNTQSARVVRGSLDKETQRIAFIIGDESDDVVEVGLESLTKDEAPIWVHFKNGTQTQTWTLIRLEAPPEAAAALEKSKE